MLKILLEVWDFIKNPKDERIQNWTLVKNIQYILILFLFELLLNFFVFIPIFSLLDYYELIVTDSRIDYEYNTLNSILFFGIVFAPLIEELIFRAGLRYNAFLKIFISQHKWQRWFKYFIYSSIIAFALIHSGNYENDTVLFYCLIPVITMTQLFGGIIITFLRVKFNLFSAIISHMLWNGALIFFAIGLTYFSKPYENETEKFSLKVETLNFNTDNQYFIIDSTADRINYLIINEYSFNHILDSLFQHDRLKDDFLINLEFESEKGISNDELKNILLDYDYEVNTIIP